MLSSSSLKFNAVSEWWEEYIACVHPSSRIYHVFNTSVRYDNLKKYIYQLEKQQHGSQYLDAADLEASESSALIDQADRSNTDLVFIPLLNQELKKIILFYESQEKELLDEVADLEELVEKQEEMGLAGGEHYLDDPLADEDDEDDDDSISRSPDATRTRRRKLSSASRSRVGHGQSPLHPIPLTPTHIILASSSTVVDDPISRHRYSISSNEDIAEFDGPPRSPKATISKLANRLRESITLSIPDNIWSSKSDYATDIRLLYKRKITTLYISVSSLKSYVEINQSGFRKILKKYTFRVQFLDHDTDLLSLDTTRSHTQRSVGLYLIQLMLTTYRNK